MTTVPLLTSRRRCRWDRRNEPVEPRIRPLHRDDGAAIDAVFDGLSARSRYLRFHSPMPVLSAADRGRLLDVDGRRHAALVAEMPSGEPIGVARLVAHDATRAELAVAVIDDLQSRGVGRRLVEALAELAGELGYAELFGDVLRDNVRIVRLLRSVFPGARLAWHDGTLRVTCPLNCEDLTITDEDMLADLLY
jgi:GNAT superfamily N-acetyltransferase